VTLHSSLPLHYFRSQHFYEMGHIYFGTVRRAIGPYQKLASQWQKVQRQLGEFSKHKKQAPQPLQKQAQHVYGQLQQASGKLEFYRGLAMRYFQEAHRLDPANAEALYIGANMELQIGNHKVSHGQKSVAASHFVRALEAYSKIESILPYFVQLHYFKGLAHKGLGNVQSKNSVASERHYHQALKSFERYEKQDPIYPPLFLDRSYVLEQLGEHRRARESVFRLLALKERGHHALFSNSRSFDTLRLLKSLALRASPAEQAWILPLLARAHSHHSSSCLLPFLPKTDRHFKNGLLLGYEYHAGLR
jgi:tetratricopeptide (TPR) repeat protein